MKLVIIRTLDNGVQTIGTGFIYDGNGRNLFSFCTLELPYKNNQRRVSCIPKGVYIVVKRNSLKFKNHLHIKNVPNREWILIHAANYNTDLLGCIAVGSNHTYLNNDGQLDVINSTLTLNVILTYLGNVTELVILETYK